MQRPSLLIGSAGLVMLGVAPALGQHADDLEPPVRLQANGEDINVEIGHAAPFLYDFDGNGARDLLVGQFGGGKLRIYRNHGTDAEPLYKDFEFFSAAGAHGTVPYG